MLLLPQPVFPKVVLSCGMLPMRLLDQVDLWGIEVVPQRPEVFWACSCFEADLWAVRSDQLNSKALASCRSTTKAAAQRTKRFCGWTCTGLTEGPEGLLGLL